MDHSSTFLTRASEAARLKLRLALASQGLRRMALLLSMRLLTRRRAAWWWMLVVSTAVLLSAACRRRVLTRLGVHRTGRCNPWGRLSRAAARLAAARRIGLQGSLIGLALLGTAVLESWHLARVDQF